MSDAHARLQRLLGGDALAPLRKRLRQRYELARDNDAFTLSDVSGAERRALEGLLARQTRDARSIRLSVAELDGALARAGLAESLRDALSKLDGPVQDRAAERAAIAARWEAAFAAVSDPALAALVDTSAGRGLVKRLSEGDPALGLSLLADTARIRARLPASGIPLSRLAAETLADAHALDAGRPVSTLALAALREDDMENARETWARHGLMVNELAWPALALNLTADADTPGGRLVTEARILGEPVHLSLRALLRAPPRWTLDGRPVYVCENPAVVAIAADRLGADCAPLVCTEGTPSAAPRALLTQLGAAGARLRYHGDFDWPGIAIGNFVMRELNAHPWRFDAESYSNRSPRSGRRLGPQPVAAGWDTALSIAMAEHGYALEEEAVVDQLLDDLAAG